MKRVEAALREHALSFPRSVSLVVRTPAGLPGVATLLSFKGGGAPAKGGGSAARLRRARKA